MILVDTSVWVSFFSREPRGPAVRLREMIASGAEVAITGLILQEVLQGARAERELESIRGHLARQTILQPRHEVLTYVEAARIYARCRWAGITPRSAVDCLIVQLAIEHDVPLHHDDSDFEQIARAAPKLRFA
jgi:predicted nucleic acid-binding protein